MASLAIGEHSTPKVNTEYKNTLKNNNKKYECTSEKYERTMYAIP